MTKPLQCYSGTLTRMPFIHQATKAEAQMLPLTTDNDFAVFAEFTSSPHPVLLNVPEHYQILSELVAGANRQWPGITIMVRISMPGGMRIPANLLADNVLLLEDVAAEEAKLVARADPLLVIEDRFTRIEIDNNDNSIHLRLYSDNTLMDNTLTDKLLQPLIEQLHSRGVVDA